MKKISILMLLASSFWGMAQERPQMNDINADDVELTPVFVGMPAIATDRPDFSETAQIVPIGWLQYEAGYQFSHVEERISLTTITNTHQFEEVFRFGVNRRFEARAIINANTQHVDYTDTWNDPARFTGVRPITIGFKYNLLEESDLRPHVTWKSHLTLPWVAAGDYRVMTQGNLVLHQQRLLLEKRLLPWLNIASNIGVSGGLQGSNGFINAGMFSVATAVDLNNGYGMFAEYFTQWFVAGTQFFGTPYVDGGFTKQWSNDLQFDIYGGYDISQWAGAGLNTHGFFMGIGMSYRLPLAAYMN